MKSKVAVCSFVLGASLATAVLFSVAAATRGTDTAWDYRIISYQKAALSTPKQSLQEALDAAGAEGWEAVGIAAKENDQIVLLKRLKKLAPTPATSGATP